MIRLHLWHWNRKGGGPRYNWELAKALAARDDVALSLSWSCQSEFADEMRALGLPSLEIDTYRDASGWMLGHARLPALRRRLAAFLRAQETEVAISTMNHLWSPFVAPAIRRAGIPYALVAHDAEPHPGEAGRIRRWTLARDIAQADGLIAATDHVAGRLAALRPDLPAARLATVPLGSFSFGPALHAPRSLPETRPVELLFFGRLLAYKGIDVLADAWRRLRRRYGARVRLRIAGQGDPDVYGPLLRDLPGVSWDNRWIAEAEVDAILARADLLVLPYREASQSGSLAAAEYAALPSVATPVGGLAEEIRRYGSGVVAEAVDGAAFAGAVERLLEDPKLYAACSAAARQTAEGPKSWAAVAEATVGFAVRLRAETAHRRTG